MSKKFYNQQTASSLIKAKIVSEYFPQYCRIISRNHQHEKIIYLDLFAGPGVYKDGAHSTPMLIGKSCANDPFLREKVLLMFNDKEYIEQLKENFNAHFPPGTFTNEPRFADREVGEDDRINIYLSKPAPRKNPTPTLLFVDPGGTKGLTRWH